MDATGVDCGQIQAGAPRPTAVVMNLYYTGLGIARSLGRRGVRVIGLSAQRRVYGNFTRHATVMFAPDSRYEPEALLEYLLKLGEQLGGQSVIFPTRDDDVLFLDRFRSQLERWFLPVAPNQAAVRTCLSKWDTYQLALEAGIPVPKTLVIENEPELHRVADEITYPCVLKPVAAHEWRKAGNWALVGERKAVCAASPKELLAEYSVVAQAGERVLLQEMVPGADDQLLIMACYLDRQSRWVAGFNTQKLLQWPETFGTGCIVRSVDCPELVEPSARLLKTAGYSGIAEIEYKWNAAKAEYQLIEINPRPWDQHILGSAVGADLAWLAYCDLAGLALPAIQKAPSGQKWIAEEAFINAVLRLIRRRDRRLWSLLSMARGRRIWAIWSVRDPLPFFAYVALMLVPSLAAATLAAVRSIFRRRSPAAPEKGIMYKRGLEKGKSRG